MACRPPICHPFPSMDMPSLPMAIETTIATLEQEGASMAQ